MNLKANKLVFAIGLLAIVSCSREENVDSDTSISTKAREPLTTIYINSEIRHSVENTGDFLWKDASDHFLWSAAYHGDFILSIGFGADNNDFARSKSNESRKIEQSLLKLIAELEEADSKYLLLESDPYLNTMDVLITKQITISKLRESSYVRYLEPANYRYSAPITQAPGCRNIMLVKCPGCFCIRSDHCII